MASELNAPIEDTTDQLEYSSLEAREASSVQNGQTSSREQAEVFIPTDSMQEETCAEVAQPSVLVGPPKRVDEKKKKLWQVPAEEKKVPKMGKQKSEVHHRPTKTTDSLIEAHRKEEDRIGQMIETRVSEKSTLPEERTSIAHGASVTKYNTPTATPSNEPTNSEPSDPQAVPNPLLAESERAPTELSSSRPKFILRLQPMITVQHGDKLQLQVRFTAQPEPTVRTLLMHVYPSTPCSSSRSNGTTNRI